MSLKAVEVRRTERTSLHSPFVCRCCASRLSTLCTRNLAFEGGRGAALGLALGVFAVTSGRDNAVLECLPGKAPERAFLRTVKRRGSDTLEGLRVCVSFNNGICWGAVLEDLLRSC